MVKIIQNRVDVQLLYGVIKIMQNAINILEEWFFMI